MEQKHFNTYKEGLDLEVLRRYCEEHGEVRTMERGETLEDVGELAQWVAFVERGCFKYMVHNDMKDKIDALLSAYPFIDTNAMGFLRGWENEPLWQ